MVNVNGLSLDKTDKSLLFELDKDCRLPSTKLARIVHKSRQAVDYRINKLAADGVITAFQASINPHKMGYKIYKVYVKLKNIPNEKEDLLNYLKSSPIVYWLGECSGTWDLIFAVFTRTDYEFFIFKNEFISKYRNSIIDLTGDPLIDVRQYPKRYFLDSAEKNFEQVMFAGEIVQNKLDSLDYLILRVIVNNARISIVELSTKTKSSIATVLSRLKKLQDTGVIIQYRVGLNLNKLGFELYKCIIKIEKYTKTDEEKLLSYVSNIPNTQYFIRNVWQIEIELVVKNYPEYYAIIEDLKKNFPDVIRSIDSVLMISDEWTPGFENLLK
ncbi:MAG: Lrp/AsnC family transcriptional regulator [archaeon]|jgi:DNA-binding Lrp family transcriptional regulator